MVRDPGVSLASGDVVAVADFGEEAVEAVEDGVDGVVAGGLVGGLEELLKEGPLGGGVFAVGLDVHGEVAVAVFGFEAVEVAQAFDLLFGYGGNLAFVGVERGDAGGSAVVAADGAEAVDEGAGGGPRLGGGDLLAGEAEAFGELEPEVGVVGGAGFLVDEVGEQVLADGLIFGLGVNGGEIGGEGGDVLVILGGVVAECVESEFAAGPGLVEGVVEQMPGGDFGLDVVKKGGDVPGHGRFTAPNGMMLGQINRSAGKEGTEG